MNGVRGDGCRLDSKSDSDGVRFLTSPQNGTLAQSVEHKLEALGVASSILARTTNKG